MGLEVNLPEIASQAGAAVIETINQAGGVVIGEGGKITLGILVKHGVESLIDRLRKAKQAGKVPPEFEKQPHGAKLLQEALRALLDGKAAEQAEAIQRVFLAMAQDEPKDSIQAIEQLQILDTVTNLTLWELMTLNLLERYRVNYRDEVLIDRYVQATQPQREQLHASVNHDDENPLFDDWLPKQEWFDKSRLIAIRKAIKSLSEAGVIKPIEQARAESYRYVRLRPEGLFSDYGWKVATYLYAAEQES